MGFGAGVYSACLGMRIATADEILGRHNTFGGIGQMAEGTIKRLTDKGFGFIDTGSDKDLFFHSSNQEPKTSNRSDGAEKNIRLQPSRGVKTAAEEEIPI